MSGDNFKASGLNEALAKNGFAVLPFCTPLQVEELKAFYAQLPAQNLPGTHVTMFNPSFDYRKLVDEKVKATCGSAIENLMNGYRCLYANFMIKEPGIEGDFPVHQDWTYVDETQFTSYAFWIPLQDVDIDNGALHVVKGSHKIVTRLRGPYVQEPFKNLSAIIRKTYSTAIKLKAGEALVWDHRLVHFSLPNITAQPRLAFTIIAVPKEAEVIHCFGLPESDGTTIEKYAVDTGFFLGYTIGGKPTGVPLLETIFQPPVEIKEKELSGSIYAAAN